MKTFARKSIALLLLSAVAACSGGSGGGSGVSAMNPMPATRRVDLLRPHDGTGMFANIVGVGDSLTAGYQSGGFLGALKVKNPFFPPNHPAGTRERILGGSVRASHGLLARFDVQTAIVAAAADRRTRARQSSRLVVNHRIRSK